MADPGFPEYPDELSPRGSSRRRVRNAALDDPAHIEPAHIDEPRHKPAIVSARSEADQRIGHDIGDVLAASKRLEGKHLLVEVVDGEVFLHGTVADGIVRSVVEQLASSVRGVGRIHNELDVLS